MRIAVFFCLDLFRYLIIRVLSVEAFALCVCVIRRWRPLEDKVFVTLFPRIPKKTVNEYLRVLEELADGQELTLFTGAEDQNLLAVHFAIKAAELRPVDLVGDASCV